MGNHKAGKIRSGFKSISRKVTDALLPEINDIKELKAALRERKQPRIDEWVEGEVPKASAKGPKTGGPQKPRGIKSIVFDLALRHIVPQVVQAKNALELQGNRGDGWTWFCISGLIGSTMGEIYAFAKMGATYLPVIGSFMSEAATKPHLDETTSRILLFSFLAYFISSYNLKEHMKKFRRGD